MRAWVFLLWAPILPDADGVADRRQLMKSRKRFLLIEFPVYGNHDHHGGAGPAGAG
jgi:hypothetical protein